MLLPRAPVSVPAQGEIWDNQLPAAQLRPKSPRAAAPANLLPPGHGQLCPAPPRGFRQNLAGATHPQWEGRETWGRDTRNFSPGERARARSWLKTPSTPMQQRRHRPTTGSPGAGASTAPVLVGSGPDHSSTCSCPPNAQHQPAWPWLRVRCGNGNRGPPPEPPCTHKQPRGEQPSRLNNPRDVHRDPSFTPKAPTLPVPWPAGRGAKPTCPEHKTAPSHPLRPGSPQDTAAPVTLLPQPGTGPPPVPPSPGTLQGPGTRDPQDLSAPVPLHSSSRSPPWDTHLTRHVLSAGIPWPSGLCSSPGHRDETSPCVGPDTWHRMGHQHRDGRCSPFPARGSPMGLQEPVWVPGAASPHTAVLFELKKKVFSQSRASRRAQSCP